MGFSALAAVCGVTAAVLPAGRASASEAAHAAMVIDANTGAVLYERNADEPRIPASLTKLMTLYLTFELIESGRLSLSSSLTISQEAANAAPSKLDLEPGEEIVVADAIRALVTKSANDIAVALAEKIGGSETNFARLMNEKARALTMTHTTFRNASGLPDPQQHTTARDILTLALHLQDDFPKYYSLFSLKSFTYKGSTFRNHNTLLFSMPGIDGMKTGYTRASGFNVVTSYRREGRHLVGTVFGGVSSSARNSEMRNLLIRALARASTHKTRAPQLVAMAKPAPKPHSSNTALAQAPTISSNTALAQAPTFSSNTALAQAPTQGKIAAAKTVLGTAAAILAPLPAGSAVTPKTAEASVTALPAPVQPAAVPMPPRVAAAGHVRVAAAGDMTVPVVAPAAEPAPTFEVARVRRVMVAPRRPSVTETAAIDPARTTDMPELVSASAASNLAATFAGPAVPAAAASPPAAPAIVATVLPPAAPVASAPATSTASQRPVTQAVRPGSGTGRFDRLAMADAVAAATTEPASVPRSSPPAVAPLAAAPAAAAGPPALPKVHRMALAGPRPPSTLAAQAAAMAAPSPTATAAPVGGAFQIQVGAFGTLSEAAKQIELVKARSGATVARYQSVTLPIQKANRMLYRARFSGLDAVAAANACNILRQQQIDCYVMHAE